MSDISARESSLAHVQRVAAPGIELDDGTMWSEAEVTSVLPRRFVLETSQYTIVRLPCNPCKCRQVCKFDILQFANG